MSSAEKYACAIKYADRDYADAARRIGETGVSKEAQRLYAEAHARAVRRYNIAAREYALDVERATAPGKDVP